MLLQLFQDGILVLSRMIKKHFLLALIFIGHSSNAETIKVKLAPYQKSVLLSANKLMEVNLEKEGVTKTGKKISFNCDFKNQENYRKSLVASIKADGPVSFQGQEFYGDIEILASSGKGCEVINNVKLENYLSSLLSKEMNQSWPLEALKAQAVAARSYALSKKMNRLSHRGFHIESSEREQVSGGESDQTMRTDLAAYMTKGLVLSNKKSELVQAYYHAHCGGKLFNPNNIWEGEFHGFVEKKCSYCKEFNGKKFKHKVSLFDLKRSLRKQKIYIKKIFEIRPNGVGFELSGVAYDNKKKVWKLSRGKFRKVIGTKYLPSFNFDISMQGRTLSVTGKGNGHGIGMCQVGALKMAQTGKNYKEILKYYYPNFKISQIRELKK